MGSSFYSVHVINSWSAKVFNVGLGACQSYNKYKIDIDQKLDEIKEYSNDVGKILKLITSFETKTATFYSIDNGGIISAVSEYFDFATMKEEVKQWFQYFDEYILVVNCFDGSIMDLSLLKTGDCITSYTTGCISDYDLPPSKFNTEIISEVFHVSPDEVENAYSDEPLKALDNFANLFKLPLKLTVLDLIDLKSDNVFKMTYFL